ncbi:hypothetical protein H8N03_22050 [Ramlibacter sp. USB13]|uniref:Uncharacterized protein n=1 Tax=Ramlibacter cellulosilyticus TaxID=2764187 RepID=A0A923MUY2_9BURK|nr:hypothetical protein [Ramlibacter cellulosilyticus]MBC5785640.1 hypothetical protein [Ramlibacter cellulosilyticus]
MKHWKAWLAQGVLYGAFALFLGVFSHWPRYQALPPGQALLKVSFIHHGQRVAPCRPYTPEELAKLPANMRTPLKCERERVPVEIEVDLDGATVFRHVAQPAGLSRDGASTVYHRLAVPAGEHRIAVRLKDAPGAAFAHTREAVLTLKEAQVLVIDFDPQKGVTLS